MSNNNEYRNLKKLVHSLANNLEALENGNLSASDLYSLLDDARNIHERIAILHYLAIERAVKKQENNGIKFNFSIFDEDQVQPNQTNLIDAIKVEHHIEAVKKSIGEQRPLFEEEKPDKTSDQKQPDQPVNKEEEQSQKNTEETGGSINDKFSGSPTLADKLGKQPIKDLTNAIGLNEKFLFMNDLFDGENDKYKEAIETINNFSAFIEADEYINNSLKDQFNWDMTSVSTQKFIILIQRRFL
jgi:hypothetical protein